MCTCVHLLLLHCIDYLLQWIDYCESPLCALTLRVVLASGPQPKFASSCLSCAIFPRLSLVHLLQVNSLLSHRHNTCLVRTTNRDIVLGGSLPTLVCGRARWQADVTECLTCCWSIFCSQIWRNSAGRQPSAAIPYDKHSSQLFVIVFSFAFTLKMRYFAFTRHVVKKGWATGCLTKCEVQQLSFFFWASVNLTDV